MNELVPLGILAVSMLTLAWTIFLHVRNDLRTARELRELREYVNGYIAGSHCCHKKDAQ